MTSKLKKHFFLTFLIFVTMFIVLQPASALTMKSSAKPSDSELADKLEKILEATQWYPHLDVQITEGLIFLKGKVSSQEKLDWAKKILEATPGVVAVIDQMDQSANVAAALSPVQEEALAIGHRAYQSLPYIISSGIIFLLFCGFAFGLNRLVKTVLIRRHRTMLAAGAAANIVAIVVVLLGIFFALRSSGLSGLAFTVLGGTGVIGLGIGLALKSSLENYASGLMISLREIFRRGEIVNIAGYEGVVQSVTTRGTTIMDYEGNYVTFPNSFIMKTTIKNMTRNPNMRTDFIIGIGYDDSIDHAREIILATLSEMPDQILADPEYLVTVNDLASSTVNLRVYFWFNAVDYSLLKIRSLVMQKIKEALEREGVSMPDDAREIIFKSPLNIISGESSPSIQPQTKSKLVSAPDLKSEIIQIRKQAAQSEPAEAGDDILK